MKIDSTAAINLVGLYFNLEVLQSILYFACEFERILDIDIEVQKGQVKN